MMQAIGMGTVSRRWIAGPGLNAEYDLKKREQEQLLQQQKVMSFILCFSTSEHAVLSCSCRQKIVCAVWPDRQRCLEEEGRQWGREAVQHLRESPGWQMHICQMCAH